MDEHPSLRAVIAACLERHSATHRLSPRQWQVCHHIRACRTEALGGLQMQCDACGHELPDFQSCRDRHCPRCQWRASLDWCARQAAQVLPITYHHLVFTLPEAINGWGAVHPEVIYDLLFAAAWNTLKTFGADPKRLDGQMGVTAVLHTWGQALTRHVHLHCLVPAGALAADGTWHPAKSTYLFPVRALSRHFRGGFVSRLRLAYKGGRLPRLSGPAEVNQVLKALMAIDWVVYSKPCITHTETVVEYLGRYSHRIALSDRRILDFDGLSVWLAYKDYTDGGKRKVMVLAGEELIRRFLLHVLPKGYTRVRHYGFLSNRSRTRKLSAIRAALAAPPPPPKAGEPVPEWPCPVCKRGHLRAISRIAPRKRVVPFYARRDPG